MVNTTVRAAALSDPAYHTVSVFALPAQRRHLSG